MYCTHKTKMEQKIQLPLLQGRQIPCPVDSPIFSRILQFCQPSKSRPSWYPREPALPTRATTPTRLQSWSTHLKNWALRLAPCTRTHKQYSCTEHVRILTKKCKLLSRGHRCRQWLTFWREPWCKRKDTCFEFGIRECWDHLVGSVCLPSSLVLNGPIQEWPCHI